MIDCIDIGICQVVFNRSPDPSPCASFNQVLSRKLYLPAVKAGVYPLPRLVSVDLQPMAPIEGVTQLQGDITSEATAEQVSCEFPSCFHHGPIIGPS